MTDVRCYGRNFTTVCYSLPSLYITMLQVSLILLVTKETGTSMILLFMNSYLVSGCDIDHCDHCDIDHWLVDPQQIDFFCNKSYFTFTITSKKIIINHHRYHHSPSHRPWVRVDLLHAPCDLLGHLWVRYELL